MEVKPLRDFPTNGPRVFQVQTKNARGVFEGFALECSQTLNYLNPEIRNNFFAKQLNYLNPEFTKNNKPLDIKVNQNFTINYGNKTEAALHG